MAGLSSAAGLGQQIGIVAALRWRILRNTLRQRNARLDLIGLLVSGLISSVFVIALGFAFFAGAYGFVSTGRSSWLSLLFWAICLWWQLFPVFIATFGASFPFKSLLRFPLGLPAFFLINLAYGFADFGALAAVCWLACVTAGVVAAQTTLLPVMLLVGLLFTLMNVMMERLVGSWLELLLSRRRAREIFFAVFILAMVGLQFIRPLLDGFGPFLRSRLPAVMSYLAPLPGSLAGQVVAAAARRDFSSVFLGIIGLTAYVLLFGALLWRRFASQYHGEDLNEAPSPSRNADVEVSRLPFDLTSVFPPQVATVIRKEFRYLTRNGSTILLLVLPPLMTLFFTFQFLGSDGRRSGFSVTPANFFPAIMAYLILILTAPAYNSFAYEGCGVQTYFMAPVRFREVLFGKNLFLVALITLELALSAGVFAYRVGLPPMPRFVATLAAGVFAITGQLVIANWSSLSFPRKLVFGQMRGQRQSGMAVLVAFGVQIVLGGLSTLVFFLGRWTGDLWLPTEVFTFLSVGAVAAYFASLEALTQFAEKKKERLIEALCR